MNRRGMRLWQARKHWELFARTDPLWAIITDPQKQDRRWTQEEFFATGDAEVRALLERVNRCRPGLARGSALDFGCGVGRLTQALARHFDRVTGVDISEEMLGHARRFNAHGDRVHYRHNTRPDLHGLADASFDLVLSMITLQHIALEYVRRYVAEFVRVCRPGGVVLFQMPATRPPSLPPLNPPTPLRLLYRWWRKSFPRSPKMEMHALPRADVETLLTSLGVTVLEVARHAEPDCESCLYLAGKP